MKFRRGATFIGLMSVVATAVAAYCCDPWGMVGQMAFTEAGQAVAAVLRASSKAVDWQIMGPESLQTTYEGGLQKGLGELQRQTAEQRVMLQGRIAVDGQLYATSVAGQAEQHAQPPPQLDTTVTHAALTAELHDVVAQKVATYDRDWSNRYLSSIPADAVSTVMARHRVFCTPGDVKAGVCAKAAIPALQGADLTINTLYHPGEGQYDTLSDQEHAAALAFVRNVTQPVPFTPPGDGHTAAGRQLTADLLADQAALALVAHSFHVQLAERTRRHE